MKFELVVKNMSCNHCKMRIENELNEIGVKNYRVELKTKTIFVETDVKKDLIVEKIRELGYTIE